MLFTFISFILYSIIMLDASKVKEIKRLETNIVGNIWLSILLAIHKLAKVTFLLRFPYG